MRVKDAAKIFSSSYLKRLAEGDFSLLSRVVSEFDLYDSSSDTVRDIYERFYTELCKHYRFEYFYKNSIINKQLLGRHSLNTATMLSEFRVGQNIADCVLLNGIATCYEIKTEYDSLERLEEQIDAYCSVFDSVYVVCDAKHIEKIVETIPSEVGIIQLTRRNTLSPKRQASDLRSRDINVENVMGSLRADEYKHLAQMISGFVPNVSNIKMYSACYQIISEADPSEIRERYREVLKAHRKPNVSFVSSLPKSLKNAGVSYKLSNRIQAQLIDVLDSNLCKGRPCITQLSEANSSS
ncbi:sce7726 family protein [Vibrio vulnificus]|uniref:sce7726 family protein n=1 Tax=Vibrio vulnificus TaxID=672 RepID=UPI000CCFD593|nr:sce7726 family protein [Vibrio vulnificus]EGR0208220.1 sce7726 family protein [Vibrio vulnificus]EHH1180556.1 sce7726 family protein [Vibrio vulnificus]EHH1191744.1 sce7726 family protein [Vibrio vulnificus]EHU4849219.1 sce7726 family protein [Vibrio vulnificus]EHU4867920.1 sce7726 family protein [Vibrio vulnificus]